MRFPRGSAAAAVLALVVPTAAFGQSPAWAGPPRVQPILFRAGAQSFRLELDWERASRPSDGAGSGRLFAAVARPSERATVPDFDLVAGLDRTRLTVGSEGPSSTRASSTQPDSSSPEDSPSWFRPFTFFVSLSGVYDSNINHDEDPLEAYGAVLGAGVRFETDDFEAEYIVNSHSYSHAESWSRLSHDVYTSYEHDLSKDLDAELIGEVNLKGSSDDRDLGNEYLLKPRLTWDLSDSNRVRLYGAYRLRRYDDIDPLRNARNYYVGTEFRQRLGSGHLDVGYRWEENESKGTRNRYKRQTYEAEYWTPFSGGLHDLTLEFKYRPQQYEARFIDDEEEEGLRRDVRWIFTAAAGFALSRHISIHPTYRFEMRTSNDPEEEWDSHLGVLALRYTFGGSRTRGPLRRPPPGSPDREVDDRPEKPVESTASAAPAAASPAEPDVPTPDSGAPPAVPSRPQPEVPKPASDAPLKASIPAPDPVENRRRRAEADRARQERQRDAGYSIQIGSACGAEKLASVRQHHVGGHLWVLRRGTDCFSVFWGRYGSLEDARRGEFAIPAALRAFGKKPSVIVALRR